MPTHRRIAPCLKLLTCWTVLLLGSCSLDDAPALRIGSNIWPGYEPLYLARNLGYYETKRIKLIDFPSAVEVMRAYRNGAIDVAALTADEALTIAETEPGAHRIFLVTDFSNGADAVLARPEIKSVSELKGRSIGAEPNALGALVLSRALDHAGLSLADVRVVPLALEEHEPAYRNGNVEAVVTFEPRRTRILAQGAHEIFSSAQIPGEVMDVLLTRESLFTRYDAAFVQLVTGWDRAVEYLRRHPEDAALRVAAHQDLSPQQFLQSIKGVKILDASENLRLLSGDARVIRSSLAKLAQIMLAHDLLQAPPPIESLPDGRWLAVPEQ